MKSFNIIIVVLFVFGCGPTSHGKLENSKTVITENKNTPNDSLVKKSIQSAIISEKHRNHNLKTDLLIH